MEISLMTDLFGHLGDTVEGKKLESSRHRRHSVMPLNLNLKPSSQRLKRSFFFLKTGFHLAPQASLKLAILLPQPTRHWDFRPKPPQLAFPKVSM